MKCDFVYKNILEHIMPFQCEKKTFEYIKSIITPYCDEIWEDASGNLIARKIGLTKKRVMLAAQIDVPTFVVTFIENDGRARFFMTGKTTPKIKPLSKIVFTNGAIGILESENNNHSDNMVIKPINGDLTIGDRGIICGDVSTDGTFICGPHSGNIAACIAILNLIENFKCSNDMYYVFATGSESKAVSQRGIKGAVYNIKPDIGISIEPLEDKTGDLILGEGPVVCLRDEHAIISEKMLHSVRKYEKISKEKIQYIALDEGTRETALFHITSSGGTGATFCIPVQEHDTDREKVKVEDIEKMSVMLENLVLLD